MVLNPWEWVEAECGTISAELWKLSAMNCTITSFGRATAISSKWFPHPRVRSLNCFSVLLLINLEQAFVHRNLSANVYKRFYTSLQLPHSAGRDFVPFCLFLPNFLGSAKGALDTSSSSGIWNLSWHFFKPRTRSLAVANCDSVVSPRDWWVCSSRATT